MAIANTTGAEKQREKTGARERGFTIVELLIAILVIGTLIGILLVGVRTARSFTGSVIDDSAVESLAKGVDAFRTDHGFVPPLVREWMRTNATGVPLFDRGQVNYNDAVRTTGTTVIQVARRSDANDETRLRNFTVAPTATAALTWDNRFSEVSLSYYLAGILGTSFNATLSDLPVDGIDGPGTYKPNRSGTFAVAQTMLRTPATDRVRAGTIYGPYINTEGTALKLQRAASATGTDLDPAGRAQLLVDRNGNAIRYYQWLNGALVNGTFVVRDENDLRVPPVIGRKAVTISGTEVKPAPSQDIKENAALRTGPDALNWAIVGAGPNKVFGDEDIDVIARQLSKPLATTDFERAQLRNEAAADNAVKIGRVE